MSKQYQILEDRDFWLLLEYEASGWLRSLDDRKLTKYWIDGFSPETAKDTKFGMEIEGVAWVVGGNQPQHPWRFAVALPQKLPGRRKRFFIEQLSLDEQEQLLELTMSLPRLEDFNRMVESAQKEFSWWSKTPASMCVPPERITCVRDALKTIENNSVIESLAAGVKNVYSVIESFDVPVSKVSPSLECLAKLLDGRDRTERASD